MNEEKKYHVIKKLVETQGNKDRAAMTPGISRRQVNRLIHAYQTEGKAAFVHGNRGRKPAITIPDEIRNTVVTLYRTKYPGANFTHFTALLKRCEGITLSVSAVVDDFDLVRQISVLVILCGQNQLFQIKRRHSSPYFQPFSPLPQLTSWYRMLLWCPSP